MSYNEEMKRPKPKARIEGMDCYDKDEIDKYLQHLEKKHYCLHMRDTETGKHWDIDFLFVAFPSLVNSGYRTEGYCRDGVKKGCTYSEYIEYGTLILSNGKLKFINW